MDEPCSYTHIFWNRLPTRPMGLRQHLPSVWLDPMLARVKLGVGLDQLVDRT